MLETQGTNYVAVRRMLLSAAMAACLTSGNLTGWTKSGARTQTATGGIKIASSEHKLVWKHVLQDGVNLAKKGHKFVLIDLYTDWCGWCKRLDRDTYSDSSVAALLNKDFVCVKLDAEDGGEGQAFAKQHKVRGYPCIIVLGFNGKVRTTSYGYKNVQDFTELLHGIVGREADDESDQEAADQQP